MGWTATLLSPDPAACWPEVGSWDCTHNLNLMIETVLGDAMATTSEPWWATLAPNVSGPMGRRAWWDLLHGQEGPAGAALLHRIVTGLEADPDRFRAMEPENGWGDYDGLLVVLRSMRDAVPEWPTTWTVYG